MRRNDPLIRCSFCGKSQDEVQKIIAGPTAYICNECNDICNEIIEDGLADQRPENVSALRILVYQYATQVLTESQRTEMLDKIHELANKIRSRSRERAGNTVAGYSLLRVVGSGNFAAVWEAIASPYDRRESPEKPERAAVKIFDVSKLTIGLMLWRFQRGIRAMQHLGAMNRIAPRSVVKIFEVSNDALAFSMQFLPGGDLQNIKILGWSDQKKIQVFREVCLAAQFAHSQGIIHRDIKPANIVLTADSMPVLTDFDIAEIKFATTMSVRSGSLGTPQFAAPEQLIDSSLEAEPTADIYSLGKLLYYLIVEEPPPFGSTEPDNLPNYLKQLHDAALRELISKAIQNDPVDRFQSVESMLTVLEDCSLAKKYPASSSTSQETTVGASLASKSPDISPLESPSSVNTSQKRLTETESADDQTDNPPLSKLYVNEVTVGSSEEVTDLGLDNILERSRSSGKYQGDSTYPVKPTELQWDANATTYSRGPLVGILFGGISLLFFMTLVCVSVMGHSVPSDSRFLVVAVLSLGVSLSISFLGGAAAAKGTLPLPFAQEHPIRFGVTGGIATFILTMVLGYLIYIR